MRYQEKAGQKKVRILLTLRRHLYIWRVKSPFMKIFLIIPGLLLSLFVFGQSEFPQPDPNFKKHLRKAYIPPQNFIKFQVVNLAMGDFIFAYERQLHDAISVEVSGGPNLMTILDPLYNKMEDFKFGYNGFSAGAGGKLFLFRPGIHDHVYMSLAYRYKRFNHPKDYKMNINFLEPSFGYTFLTKENLGIEFQVGYKLIIYNNEYVGDRDVDSFEFISSGQQGFDQSFNHLPVYVHVNIGYLF